MDDTAALVDAFCERLTGGNFWNYRTVLVEFARAHPDGLPTDGQILIGWVTDLVRAKGGDAPLRVATRRDYYQRLGIFYDWARKNYPALRALPKLRPHNFGRKEYRRNGHRASGEVLSQLRREG